MHINEIPLNKQITAKGISSAKLLLKDVNVVHCSNDQTLLAALSSVAKINFL